ncbi:MAG: DUF1553 domain-containing protein [Gemmataceae bacterium]
MPERFVLLFALAISSGFAVGQSNPEEHFEKKVRPLLVERCWKCHGEETSRSELRLDSREAILKGGKRGRAVETSIPPASLLLQVVKRTGELKMPPDGPLSPQQVADLELWVNQGAVFPKATKIAKAESSHWSFLPLANPKLPSVKKHAWVTNPIDQFILSKLEAANIQTSPEADRLSLIRRLSLDLTGIAPTYDEIQTFIQDQSPNAYEKLVDRYLASPAYGERWGRHWLDIARYADSNGLDENVAHGNAWRYRDYVIRSMNENLPFNQFIIEQIAGDLLPHKSLTEKHSRLVATGYLSLGPKVLAEVDKKKMEMDIIDEQIETMGKTFMGMTLGCARCHDHKFDPISTGEYYSLAGVFKSTKTMESLVTIAKWNENVIASEAEEKSFKEHSAKIAASKKAAEDFLEEQRKQLEAKDKLPKDKKATAKEVEAKLEESAKAELKKIKDVTASLEKSLPEVATAMGVSEGNITDVAIHLRGNTERLGKVMPRAVPVVLSANKQPKFSEKSSGRLEIARWVASDANPLTARVIVNRVWRWHFGQGIVASVDNFGLLGEKPSHPELLEWLAKYFTSHDWSIKDLHRLILLSSTYRQSSANVPESARKDSGNRLYWRFTPRRMEAEVIRDSMLSITRELDRSMGGSMLQVKNRAFFFDHTSKDTTKYDSPRRSVYLPIVRNNLYEVFSLFDSTDAAVANGDRASTTIAPQALFFLNSKLVMDSAETLAKRALGQGSLLESQISFLYETALGRAATPSEIAHGKDFLGKAGALTTDNPTKAMAALAQVVLASNEFVTLR